MISSVTVVLYSLCKDIMMFFIKRDCNLEGNFAKSCDFYSFSSVTFCNIKAKLAFKVLKLYKSKYFGSMKEFSSRPYTVLNDRIQISYLSAWIWIQAKSIFMLDDLILKIKTLTIITAPPITKASSISILKRACSDIRLPLYLPHYSFNSVRYSWFHKKGIFSVHSFNDDYLSIPERPGS